MDRERVDSLVELAASIAGKADVIEDVIVLYNVKGDPRTRCLDNMTETGSALLLVESFKFQLLVGVHVNDSD